MDLHGCRSKYRFPSHVSKRVTRTIHQINTMRTDTHPPQQYIMGQAPRSTAQLPPVQPFVRLLPRRGRWRMIQRVQIRLKLCSLLLTVHRARSILSSRVTDVSPGRNVATSKRIGARSEPHAHGPSMLCPSLRMYVHTFTKLYVAYDTHDVISFQELGASERTNLYISILQRQWR